MSRGRVVLVTALLALGTAGWSSAQGLGDAAAREKARRAQQAKPKQPVSLTNEDLEKGRPPGIPAPAAATQEPAPVAGSESSDGAPPDALAERTAQEQPLTDALTAAQERLSAVEARIRELGDKLNPMSGSFIYGPSGSNDVGDEMRTRQELSQAQAQLTSARQDVAAANEALMAARRRGRPAVVPDNVN
jgi:hypothetical protein